MILTITLNPSIDRTIFVEGIRPNGTNRVQRTEIDAGGKGVNLSRVAHELGAETFATGFLGGHTGAMVRSVLKREGVPYEFVPVHGDTRLNISAEDGTGNPPTTFNERGPEVHSHDWTNLVKLCQRHTNARWICMGGSLPPGLEPDAYLKLCHELRREGIRVCIDADGDPLKHALGGSPNLIKPNKEEAERVLGQEVPDLETALQAAVQFHEQGIEFAMISMGSQGAVLASKEGKFFATSPAVEVRSTIGSGDSLLGGFLASLERGEPVKTAFQWGIAAGAATAISSGAEIGRADDIRGLFPKVHVQSA